MFEDVLRKLADLRRRAELLHGEHQVPLKELFPDDFMLLHTDFPSFEAMLEASGYIVTTPDEFKAIPDDVWDDHVKAHSQFANWDDMKNAAAREWALRRLGLDPS